jgi:hypothetical protein
LEGPDRLASGYVDVACDGNYQISYGSQGEKLEEAQWRLGDEDGMNFPELGNSKRTFGSSVLFDHLEITSSSLLNY